MCVVFVILWWGGGEEGRETLVRKNGKRKKITVPNGIQGNCREFRPNTTMGKSTEYAVIF